MYQPKSPPLNPDAAALAAYLFDELQAIAQAQSDTTDSVQLSVLAAAIKKPRDGMLIFADGVNVNATAGKDLYMRRDGVWVKPGRQKLTSKSADYTFVMDDADNAFIHPSADTTARIWTIPADSSVAYPVGTTLTLVNQNAAGVISIAITTDTMRLSSAGTTGTRSLAANGTATAHKVTTTEWLISGFGLT